MATFEAWHDIFMLASKDEEYSHIFLVPFVALGMIWFRRMRLRHCQTIGRHPGCDPGGGGLVDVRLRILSRSAGDVAFGAVIVTLGCMLSVLGKNVVFRFFPAIAVLVFLVPMPGRIRQEIALPLQTWTANCCPDGPGDLRRGGGGFRQHLSINGEKVTVAEACNGLRHGVSADSCDLRVQLCACRCGTGVRLLLLLASPLVAIFCNVVRTMPTVWLYGKYDPHDHFVPDTFTRSRAGRCRWCVSAVAGNYQASASGRWCRVTRFPLASQNA